MARRRQNDYGGFSDINITPLMDLTFLLLIVFMITAPMLEYAFDVKPPQLDAKPVEPVETMVVTRTATGNILLDGQSYTLPKLEDELQQRFNQNPTSRKIMVRGDASRPYAEIIELMRVTKRAGFSDIALLTQPEQD